MFSKVAFLACLCATSAFGAGIRKPLAREQPGVGQDVELTHAPLTTLPLSFLKVSCQDGGVLAVELETENIATRSNIVIGGANQAAACTSADFAFPIPDGSDPATVATTATELCGRTLVEGALGNQYRWTVVVNEKITTNLGLSRDFVHTTVISCDQTPAESNPVEAPQGVDTVDEGEAEFNQDIEFSIVKTVDLVDGRWEFVLSPTVEGSLGELNFKIRTCSASPVSTGPEDPEVPEGVSVLIIAASCIEDFEGTEVDVTASPASQTIAVYPFHFSDYENLPVELTCQVDLCSNGAGGANCAAIQICGTPQPEPTSQPEPVETVEPVTEEPLPEETQEPLPEETQEPVTDETIPRRHVKAVRKVSPRRAAAVRRASVHRLRRSVDKVYLASVTF